MRRTRGGDLIIEVAKGDPMGIRRVEQVAVRSMGGTSAVRRLRPVVKLAVSELDELVTASEVEDAVKSLLREKSGSDPDEVMVTGMAKGYGGMRRDLVKLSRDSADLVAKAGRMKVGWVSCRVQARAPETRCYRCQRVGHVAANYNRYGSETVVCGRCGEEGHISTACQKAARC